MDNVRDEERMPSAEFQADPGTIRMVIDYPVRRGQPFARPRTCAGSTSSRTQLGDEDTLIWLPHFLSDDRKADLSTLIVINYVLERDRLTEVTPDLDRRRPAPRPHPAREPGAAR